MKMKSFQLLFILLLGCLNAITAQNDLASSDDMGRIALRPMLMYSPELQESNRLALRNKLAQIVLYNGLGATGSNSRFVLTAKAVVVNKNIIESTPVMFAYTMEISFYIVDNIAHKVFSQFTIAKKGVGKSEAKAMAAVIEQIIPTDVRLSTFVQKGKEAILEYYNANCDIVIEKATALIANNEKEKGVEMLLNIPAVNRECYDRAMQLVKDNRNENTLQESDKINADQVKEDDGSLDWIGK